MPGWLRRTGGVLALLLLVVYATVPLLSAGFLRDDFACLATASEVIGPEGGPGALNRIERLLEVEGTEGHPLAGASVVLSAWLASGLGAEGGQPWSPAGARLLRLENLALLLIAAWGLGRFVRRLLRPWTGSDQGAAAGWTAFLLFALHPMNAATVASVAARGDLLAAALGTHAGAAFLLGRQERRYGLIAQAGVLTILAGLSSGLALVLPLILAGSEYVSARRYRPVRTRVRTAINTALVFSACAVVDTMVRSWPLGGVRPPGALADLAALEDLSGALRVVAIGLERLGMLILPVNASGIGVLGYAIAGLCVLAALQPALVSARSAPKLWGWVLFGWAFLLLLAELPDPTLRVQPTDLSGARALFAGSAVAAGGMAVGATALPGLRRNLIPLVLALGFSILGHANALPWAQAAGEVDRLRSELRSARAVHGADACILVIDPPTVRRGVDGLGAALPWLVHPRILGEAPGSSPQVRALTRAGFRILVREREFEELRERGLVVLSPLDAGGPGGAATGAGARRMVRVPPPEATTGTRSWRREGRSPALDAEAPVASALRVRAAEGSDPTRPPRLAWRARSPIWPDGSLAGAWIAAGAEPTAVFDLSRSLAWLLGERIQRVWPAEGWSRIVEAELLDRLPGLGEGVEPQASGGDWAFDPPGGWVVESSGGRGDWLLSLLDLPTLELHEIPLRVEDDRLLAPGAAKRVADAVRRGGGPIAWSLEYRIGGSAVAEARGRRVGPRGTVEESGGGEGR